MSKKYIIAGKTESYLSYLKKNNYTDKQAINVRTKKCFDKITEDDVIVLLSGWWGRSWAKESIKEIVKCYPSITFEYLDGKWGEEERKTLQSETISNRFSILDL